jgi:hypothetical protein
MNTENRFTTRDLILIALLAAIGLAVKPLIKTLFHFISTPLGIPGGTLAGGFYAMWLTLAMALVKRFGTASLTGLLQGFAVMITGWFGSHGILSIITYALPGLIIDALALLYRHYDRLSGQILYCLVANLSGTWLVGFMIMRLPKAPFIMALALSIISGVIGGLLSYAIFRDLKKFKLV